MIENVRENCLEDGLDEAVLQELKSLWETKLTASKAVEEVREVDKLIGKSKTLMYMIVTCLLCSEQ